ncbi:helix-turn-helix domain-containing protein [Gordonia McavH-238-E]|uniref:helix-turn-helix domain-containing protein n=1 Tax=Gordonia sp. McavH-238-E TaxID=2917736 RepID=UPI001EF663B2|nr:helix-turn-helix domain-containing protein [Gordonia sp. McavH-238-E]MCG7632941.1 helix-turn-helix domain-containing protein [Gordonia sp. McavH-238-E]
MTSLRATGIEEWSQLCSDSFVPLRAVGDDTFRGEIDHRVVGDLGVSRVRCTRSVVRRSSRLIAREPRDDLLLSVQVEGDGLVSQAGRTAQLRRGAAAFYEADREYELRFDRPMSEIVLQVPRDRLAIHAAGIREATARSIEAGDSAVTVLRHLLIGVLETDAFAPDQEHEVAEAAIGLLSAALRPMTTKPSTQLNGEALVVALSARIRRESHDPGLSFDDLARRHGISRRYLDLLFGRQGETPASYLRRIRLERAEHLMLTDRTSTISSVAHRVGFGDVNTFIRAFRRTHGVTPSAWRHEQPSPADESA